MRTILVNPRRTRRRNRSRRRGGAIMLRNASLMPNPRRSHRRRSGRRHKHWGLVSGHQRRTHNPFMMNPRRGRRYARRRNPLILPNRRYRRRNAGFSIGGAFNTVLMGAIGGGGAFALNKFLIAKIQQQPDLSYPDSALYWHIGARAVASALAGFFLPTSIASAANGALAYASIDEIFNYRAAINASSSGADLSGLEADLSDVLDGY